MLSFEQKIVITFLVLELVTVTVLVLLTYVFKLYFSWEKRSNHKKRAKILNFLTKKEKNIAPPYLHQPNLWLKVLGKTDQISHEEKSQIISEYLLDRVRANISSRNWLKRYYLVKAYQYAITPYDKDTLMKLINDELPIISLSAVSVSYALSSEEIYQAIIDKLLMLDAPTQKIYISSLTRDTALLSLLKKTLSISPSTELKQLCYTILSAIGPNQSFFELAKEDTKENNMECRLSAIPVLAEADPEKAMPMMKELLQDSNWLVRNKVAHTLSLLHHPKSLPLLADCLSDENRWVRVNAAKGLAQLGDEGKLLLAEYKGMDESVEPSLAAYFLEIQKMREHS